MDTGTLRSLVAWDAVRLVNLSRWALQLGWINRAAFVHHAGRLSQPVREAYGTWSEVSAAYVVAVPSGITPKRARKACCVRRGC